ncbi:hypothetical protein BGZ46_007538 [Entomortierella lignicola]|nr:hypothetical protein BGZ46_007538 [Entomortierella lignicola]
MESSSPTENISNFIASRNTATLTGHQHSAHQSYRSQQSPAVTTVFSSTPMQRSLTHNPAMTSFSSSSSNIAAATSDPSSVSISVISSSPVSSVQTPALSASTSPSRERSTTYSERDHNVESVTGDRDIASNFNSINTSNGIPLDTESEADDRIHFRLLNNIYFSTSTRRPRHGVDLRMNLPVTPNDSELNMNREIVYAGEDSNMVEDAMDYENTRPQVTTQGEESASVMILLQQNHPDSSDEDDDDIDMDHAIENRHIRGAEEMSMDLEPSSPSSSRVERPQNAQLSPRSAAALTNMFSDGRTSWPQPIFNSSISSDLVALSEGRAGHEYDNNPYFRRPPPFSPPREANTRRRIDTGTHNRLRMSNMRPDDASRTRSTSTQYNMIQGGYSSQLTIRGSGITSHGGCGENTQATSNEAQGDVWPLNFEMYHADGGEFNATHSVENVLKNDSSVYWRSNNINICLRLAEPHQSFVLTQFRAKAPTAGFTAPCKEGLIFVSHEPISLEKTVIFDNMTREHYEEYMQSLNQGLVFGQMLRSHGANADALIPAAFFQLEGPDETCTLDLTPNRSGRYVLIKLLRSRCTNPLQRPENIDLQYLGLIASSSVFLVWSYDD